MPALTAQQLQAIAQASTGGLKPSPLGLAGLNAQAQAAFGGIPDQANVGGILPTAPQIAPQAPAAKPAGPAAPSTPAGSGGAGVYNPNPAQGGPRGDRSGTPPGITQMMQNARSSPGVGFSNLLTAMGKPPQKPGGGAAAPKPPAPPPIAQHATQFAQKYGPKQIQKPAGPNPVLEKLGFKGFQTSETRIVTGVDPSAQMPPDIQQTYRSTLATTNNPAEALAAASAHDHVNQVVANIWGGSRW